MPKWVNIRYDIFRVNWSGADMGTWEGSCCHGGQMTSRGQRRPRQEGRCTGCFHISKMIFVSLSEEVENSLWNIYQACCYSVLCRTTFSILKWIKAHFILPGIALHCIWPTITRTSSTVYMQPSWQGHKCTWIQLIKSHFSTETWIFAC